MHYLALTILSSVSVAAALKFSEVRGGNRAVVAAANYVITVLVALIAGGGDVPRLDPSWWWIAPVLGAAFVAGLFVSMMAVHEIGLAVPTGVARLSMLVPVLGSILLFEEQPTPLRLAGMGLGAGAFLMLMRAGGSAPITQHEKVAHGRRAAILLVTIFLLTGTVDLTLKTSQRFGVDRDALALAIFTSALLFCVIIILVRRIPVRGRDLALGALVGIPNYCSLAFLFLALRSLDASIVFPMCSAGVLVSSALVGMAMWRETPNRLALVGIGLAAAAVVLLGIAG